MSDSSEIDNALSTKLLSDTTLMALMPDGVFFDVAQASMVSSSATPTRFVIVSLLSALDTDQFRSTAYESPIYMVKAVMKSDSGATTIIKNAAARIQTLLHDQSLTIPGYGLMTMHRIERIRFTEPGQTADANWWHRGGQYLIEAVPS